MDPQKMFSDDASCEDVMQCFYNLNEFDLKVYLELVEKGSMRADKLAKNVKKDSTTVYRDLQKLISCGICFRETKNIERGGYFHEYIAVNPKVLKKKIIDCIKQWTQK